MTICDDLILNYHVMHPGGDSIPGDPNAAFYLEGAYHLHYILRHLWKGEQSYSFVHVSSPDMLHWTWRPTKLQPSFTGHGMFSGTGFITKEGKAATIYHGQDSGQNYIAIAKDKELSAWKKPYAVSPKTAEGHDLDMHFWDPDCFLINDTYYAISGGRNQPLMKSKDLITWVYVGDFLKHELPDTVIGEDISCPNFFPIGNKWMLLCISHSFGCRYYLGDWDAEAEQFVPESHARMNWRRPDQSLFDTVYRDFFAPETVLTPDGRRVMWAWLWTLHEDLEQKSIQSLPRELSLSDNGSLLIRPLRELESLRNDPLTLNNLSILVPEPGHSGRAIKHIIDLNEDSFELKITIDRLELNRKRFSILLFANEKHEGLPIMVRPETSTILLGNIEAPFAVSDLPEDEDLELRIFIDKYLVEVFVNERQALLTAYMDHQIAKGLYVYAYGATLTIRQLDIWKLKATNQGFFDARADPIWTPKTN